MAAEKLAVYKCEICGNIVEVLHGGKGDLVCCGQNMKLMSENTTDAATEKHVPVIEKTDKGVLVKVGSVDHPMEEKHYIEWIEIVDEECGWVKRKMLKPGDKPMAEFVLDGECAGHIYARAYCNLHGHWKKEA